MLKNQNLLKIKNNNCRILLICAIHFCSLYLTHYVSLTGIYPSQQNSGVTESLVVFDQSFKCTTCIKMKVSSSISQQTV